MAGARGLWRATGMTDDDFGKPIIAIANSFTQFVPGHVHLKDLGGLVADAIYEAGGIGREFNTIAVDDGIAMGHDGMLYSLPSREIIADAVEFMANAHCADGLVCISNCDKITPGMLMAAMRLNIPTIFVSGGPMEAGKIETNGEERSIDLIDAMVQSANPNVSDDESLRYERSACPTCGSCSGMFTANSMNCLTEAIGLAQPGNGSLLATHHKRGQLFKDAGRRIVALTKRYYEHDDDSVLPRRIAAFPSFENAMAVDIAMGGSTNTVLHLLAAAREGEISFGMNDIDRLSRTIPNVCKIAPSSHFHMEDFHRAGGVMAVLGELKKAKLLHEDCPTVMEQSIGSLAESHDITNGCGDDVRQFYLAAPGGVPTQTAFSQNTYYNSLDDNRALGCIRSIQHAYSKDGGLAVLTGNIAIDGCIVKTAGVDESLLTFRGPAHIFESQEDAVEAILNDDVRAGEVLVIRYEGPKGGPGMQEMLYPTSYLKAKDLGKDCALITDGRFSGGTSGLSIGHISPEAAEGGALALVEQGDTIIIDIPKRTIRLDISDEELRQRRKKMDASKDGGWQPAKPRPRKVSQALKAYAALTTSASNGAVRQLL